MPSGWAQCRQFSPNTVGKTTEVRTVFAVQAVLTEYGPDLSCFPDEKQFVSHLTLAPKKAITGGKPVKKKRKRGSASTRVAEALRMAATSMRHSQTALGAYYRQIARRIGADVAVFATARKLATLIFRMLRWGQPRGQPGASPMSMRARRRMKSAIAKPAS